jgi:hypothetical protein
MFENRDVYFMLGTEYRYNNFIIGGIYYPPITKTRPTTLDKWQKEKSTKGKFTVSPIGQ